MNVQQIENSSDIADLIFGDDNIFDDLFGTEDATNETNVMYVTMNNFLFFIHLKFVHTWHIHVRRAEELYFNVDQLLFTYSSGKIFYLK